MIMDKKHFFIKLIAPRPTFAQDMTEDERKLMMTHIAYWRDLTEKRISLVFGPVFDPAGNYGMAIIEVEDEAAAKKTLENDPTIIADQNFSFEIYPMRVGMERK